MKLSHPLTKAIRTTEGVLVVVSNVAVAVTSAIDPSTLSHKTAAFVVGGQNLALLVQRGVIKAAALGSLAGLPVPGQVLSAPVESAVTADAVNLTKTAVDVVEHGLESAVKAGPETPETPAAPLVAPATPATPTPVPSA